MCVPLRQSVQHLLPQRPQLPIPLLRPQLRAPLVDVRPSETAPACLDKTAPARLDRLMVSKLSAVLCVQPQHLII